MRWLLPAIAIAHHLFYLLAHSRITYDEMLQIGAARAFLNGDGLVIRHAAVGDLASIASTPLFASFPPAYALIVSFLSRFVVAGDMGLADFFLKTIAVVLFWCAWGVILEQVRVQIGTLAVLIVWLFWGLLVSPVMVPGWTAHTNGMLALALFSCNLACAMLALRRCNWPLALAGGMCMGLAMSLRYAYLPMVAVVPLSLCLSVLFLPVRDGEKGKIINYIRLAGVNGLGSGIVCAGFLIYNYLNFGRVFGSPAQVQARGFFPENLLHIIPFPLHSLGLMHESFFGSRGVTRQISLPPAVPGDMYAWLLALCVFAAFVTACFCLRRGERELPDNGIGPLGARAAWCFVLSAGVVTFLVNVGFLAALSLRIDLLPWSGGWTYLSELRYFAPSLCFLLPAVAAVVVAHGVPGRTVSGRMGRVGLCAVLVVAFWVVGGWRVSLDLRQVTQPESFSYGIGHPLGRQQLLPMAYERLQAKRAIMELPVVVVVDERNLMVRGQAQAMGWVDAPVEDWEGFSFKASQPAAILVVLPSADAQSSSRVFLTLAHRYSAELVVESADGAVLFFVLAPPIPSSSESVM